MQFWFSNSKWPLFNPMVCLQKCRGREEKGEKGGKVRCDSNLMSVCMLACSALMFRRKGLGQLKVKCISLDVFILLTICGAPKHQAEMRARGRGVGSECQAHSHGCCCYDTSFRVSLCFPSFLPPFAFPLLFVPIALPEPGRGYRKGGWWACFTSDSSACRPELLVGQMDTHGLRLTVTAHHITSCDLGAFVSKKEEAFGFKVP